MAYYFRLPVITDLTIEQQAVLSETDAIAITGGPGTGKSVVALWRHIQNHGMKRRNSLLLTYTKSLESYLASSASSENSEAGENINRTLWWSTTEATSKHSEIIIDEAQDVNASVYERIKTLSPLVSYSADNNQILYPRNSTTEMRLNQLFNKNKTFTLRENYRNTKQIVKFVKSMFPNSLISNGKIDGPVPRLVCAGGIHGLQTTVIKEIIDTFYSTTHNIAVLLPVITHVEFWHQELTSLGYNCSKYTNSDGDIGAIQNIHVTTFKSSKGLEFDTVIIPNFHQYQTFINSFDVVEENDFYVVFTRARRNLILIDNGAKLDNNINLPFLKVQIEREIISVDNSYLKNDLPILKAQTDREIISVDNSYLKDDLPF
jgi:superfamily I DNA/RNA helicase